MTPHDLIAAFDDVADAPDGVKRLRELVLQLAVRGKLVPQDPADEPSNRLVLRIQRQKSAGNRQLAMVAVPESDRLFAVPPGWCSVQFTDYALDIATGPFGTVLHQSDYKTGGIPLVNPSHMVNGRIVPDLDVAVSEATAIRLESYRLHAGDIVMARRGEVGRAALVTEEEDRWLCGTGSFFVRFTKEVPREFIMLLLRSHVVRDYLGGEAVGTTMSNLNHGILKRMPVPVPPLAEQHRIVAKVDELMAFLDKLEATKNARDGTRTALRDAALAGLRDADGPDDVEVAWGRIAGQMDDLFAEPGDVGPLRQAVLQLAVRGRLVRRDAGDEPAGKLLERIGKAKKRIATERRVRVEQSESPLQNDEVPFPLPESWMWCRTEQICWQITDGTHYTPTYVPQGVPFLSVKDMSGGVLDFSNTRYIEPDEHETLAQRCRPERGDMLLTKVGTTGIAVEVDTDQEFSLFVSVALLKGFPELVLPKYLQHALNSPVVKRQSAEGTEGIGNKNLVLRKIRTFAIPVAPVKEQARIVAKVDELMTLLDKLEARLREAKGLQGAFAAAAVHHLDVDVAADVTTGPAANDGDDFQHGHRNAYV